MKVTFFSNFFNSHQLPLAREFNAMGGVEYAFVSLLRTEGVVGRKSLDHDYPFVLREYDGGAEAARAMRHAVEDEVVVFGDMAGKERYVKARAKTGKLFFRYSERLLKRGDWWRFAPPKIYRTRDRFTRYKDANMYVLCASAYTARDLAMFGFPTEKCLKWGYFPDVEAYDGPKPTLPGYETLCSAQRLIPWKRVDLQVQLASRLRAEGVRFKLRIAGDGPERPRLEAMVERLGVGDCVEFLGELSHEQTIQLMRDSEVFLATSNRKEGWGATINEAMASGCCVVASEEMGSVPFLIKPEKNGFAVSDWLSEETVQLFSQRISASDCSCISRVATETICDKWNAHNAAERLLGFASDVKKPSCILADDGPVSCVENE